MTTQWLHRDGTDGWFGYTLESGILGMYGFTGKGDARESVMVWVTPEQLTEIGWEMMELGHYLIDQNLGERSPHATPKGGNT